MYKGKSRIKPNRLKKNAATVARKKRKGSRPCMFRPPFSVVKKIVCILLT